VCLTLDAGGDQFVHLGGLAAAEAREVVPAAFRAGPLIVADLVFDLAGDDLTLLLGVLASLLQRGDAGRLGAGGIADLLRDRRHLLGALAEDMALELLDGGLHGGELLAQLRQRFVLGSDRLRLHRDDLLRRVERAGGIGEIRLEALDLVAPPAAMILTAHRRL
jgi:hypothetical protein